MKKGYRLSANQAYFNYKQIQTASFAPMDFVNNAIGGANNLASTVGRKIQDPFRNMARQRNLDLQQGIQELYASGQLDYDTVIKAINEVQRNSNSIKAMNQRNTALGYGAGALGAIGLGGAGLAGYNDVNGRQIQQQMY